MVEVPKNFPECDKRYADLFSDGLGGCFESFSCSLKKYGNVSCGSLISNNVCPLKKKFIEV